MKKYLLLIVALVSALLLPALAHADAINSPNTAPYISALPQSIPANSTQWYKFDYVGDKSLITIIMPNGTDTLVEFNVFTPEQAQTWWDPKTKPIGRGTAYSIDCSTGEEVYWGECKSRDLKWKGQFNFPGTFFVQVANYNTGPANFTLDITGTGVRVPPPPQPTAPPPAVKAVAPPQPKPILPTTGGVWLNWVEPKPRPLQIPSE